MKDCRWCHEEFTPTLDGQVCCDAYCAEMLEKRTGEVTPAPEIEEDYHDDLDGDHGSALASAGWGTDEDYGCYGGEDY
jgi:hypothetical protein